MLLALGSFQAASRPTQGRWGAELRGALVAFRQQADRHKVGGAKTRVDGSK